MADEQATTARQEGTGTVPDGERAEFTNEIATSAESSTANVHTIERTHERDAAPQDYGDDDGAPIGPSEEEEAAFLAEEDSSSHSSGAAAELATSALASAATGVQARAVRVEADAKTIGPLPSLETLRAKIAPEVLGLMDELFRAKLTRVVRVSERGLKAAKRSR